MQTWCDIDVSESHDKPPSVRLSKCRTEERAGFYRLERCVVSCLMETSINAMPP